MSVTRRMRSDASVALFASDETDSTCSSTEAETMEMIGSICSIVFDTSETDVMTRAVLAVSASSRP